MSNNTYLWAAFGLLAIVIIGASLPRSKKAFLELTLMVTIGVAVWFGYLWFYLRHGMLFAD
ncbi:MULTISPECIES: hypothetical protein [unclassified Bradyrhizobium]|uniref:hypothetical protein n=1 Tax=unclassified Bradyrhizobium TaxID=2631580 RepID=UPI002FF27074